jgi:hypothetical protein
LASSSSHPISSLALIKVAFLANVGTRTMTNPYGAGESRSIATDDMAILHRRSKEFRITNTVEVSGTSTHPWPLVLCQRTRT